MTAADAFARRSDRFRAAIAAIDAANADDPFTIEVDGVDRPKELAHAEMACDWLLALEPSATDEQLLAARAHHLRRWELPRTDYPDGRAGYLRWRAEQKRRHAVAVGEILRSVGYGDDTVERVGSIIRKEALSTDPAVQVHEDALCLVFLGTQFRALADDLGDDKTVDVLVKTMRKMSPAGLDAAASLALDDQERRLLGLAVAALGAEPGST